MKQEVITIDDMKIIVTEIKVKTARKLMSNMIEVFKGDVNVEVLLNEKYDLIVEIANDFIKMPEGSSIDDLTYGDIKDALWPVFRKVNQSFLDDLTGFVPMFDKVPTDQINTSLEDSTKPS